MLFVKFLLIAVILYLGVVRDRILWCYHGELICGKFYLYHLYVNNIQIIYDTIIHINLI